MDFHQRSYQKELLDREDIPFPDIARNMRELDFINTWLGGHAITLRGLRQLAGPQRTLHICEIGCGGGDNLKAILHWCEAHHIQCRLTGIDINPECLVFARDHFGAGKVEWIHSDYKRVDLSAKPPDIIFSSLFCHHFPEAELVTMLQWMAQYSRAGFFINDLHRHPLAYYSIKWLTGAFSGSYLVKNDAPLSVLRGFNRMEWTALLQQAGIENYQLHWAWAFRWLLVCPNKKQGFDN